jgi:hypothetical protein
MRRTIDTVLGRTAPPVTAPLDSGKVPTPRTLARAVVTVTPRRSAAATLSAAQSGRSHRVLARAPRQPGAHVPLSPLPPASSPAASVPAPAPAVAPQAVRRLARATAAPTPQDGGATLAGSLSHGPVTVAREVAPSFPGAVGTTGASGLPEGNTARDDLLQSLREEQEQIYRLIPHPF